MIDFTNLSYLKAGTEKQQRAYHALHTVRVFDKLSRYEPVLTGTIPLCIDIDTSDLDIICCFEKPEEFRQHLYDSFHHMPAFTLFTPKVSGAIAATFQAGEFIAEIFGQAVPVQEQMAYRHMLVEHRILEQRGEAFRKQIIELKKQGFKTEPAFGKLLGISGNVYEELLKFEV